MAHKPQARTLYHIGCPCGGTFSMDARGFGRPVVCKRCGGSFTIGWAKDPRTQKTMPIAVGLAKKRGESTPLQVACTCGYRRAVTAEEAAGHNRCPGCGRMMIVVKPPQPKAERGDQVVALPTPKRSDGSEPRLIRIDPGTQTIDCVCGEKVLVRSESIGQTFGCPGCGRKIKVELKDKSSSTHPRVMPPGSRTPTPTPGFSCECGRPLEIAKLLDGKGTLCACGRTVTMEKIRGPQTKHTIVRPRFGPKGGLPPTPAPPSRAPEKKPAAPSRPTSEGIYEMPAVEFTEVPSAPASSAEPGTQAVFCPCGEALMVGGESVGRNIQCPTCMMLIAVDKIRDGNSSNFVLRVRAIGKMDQDTWSLNDFS